MSSDVTLKAVISGSSAGAVQAFNETALAADATGTKIGDTIEAGSTRAGGALNKLSTLGASFGLPMMGSLSTLGDKFEDTSTKGQKFGAAVSEVGKVALVGGAAALVAFGGDAVKLGNQLEDSQASLKAAVDASGESLKQYQPEIDATEQKMAALGFTNTDVNNALAKSVISTQNVGTSLSTMTLAADLARAKNVDLGTATTALDKALTGNLRPLTQMGISLPITASSALKLQQASDAVSTAQAKVNAILLATPDAANAASAAHATYETAVDKVNVAEAKLAQQQSASTDILDALSQRLGGQAAAAADTFSGKVNVLKTNAEDLGAKVGTVLIPIIEGLAGFLAKNTGAIDAVAIAIGVTLGAAIAVFAVQKVQQFVGGITSMIKGLAGLVTKMSATSAAVVGEDGAIITANEAVGASWLAMLGPIGLVAAAAAAAYEILKPTKLGSGDITPAQGAAEVAGMQTGANGYAKASPGQVQSTISDLNSAFKTDGDTQMLNAAGKLVDAAGTMKTAGTDTTATAALSTAAANKQLAAAEQQAAAASGQASATKSASAASTKLNADELALQKTGTAAMNAMVTATHSSSLQQLDIMLNATHTAATGKLVSELNATHSTALAALATKLENDQQAEESKRTSILTSDAKAGTSALNTQLNLTTSTSLSALNTGLNATHNKALSVLEAELDATHEKNLESLVTQVVEVHKEAMANLVAQAAAASAANNLSSSQALAAGVGLQEQVNEDTANLAGLTGDALAVGQAQLTLDQKKLDDANQSYNLGLAVNAATGAANKATAQAAEDNFNAAAAISEAQLAATLSAATNQQTIDSNAASAAAANVPALAAGGIVSRPTLALVGEAGPEIVIPLSLLPSASTGSGSISPLPPGLGTGSSGHTVNFLPGSIVNGATGPQIGSEVGWALKNAR